MALEPPAGRIQGGGCVLREERARAGLIAGAEIIVFGFVALERSGEKLVDGDGAHAGGAQLTDVEDGEVEDVEDDEREEEILGGFSEDSHGGRGAQGYRKAFERRGLVAGAGNK